MDEISGDYNRFFRGDAGNESTFEYAGFIPRDRLYRCICDTGTLFGKRELRFAWPEGGLLIGFLAAAALSCLTALWPGYAADGVADEMTRSPTACARPRCRRSCAR